MDCPRCGTKDYDQSPIYGGCCGATFIPSTFVPDVRCEDSQHDLLQEENERLRQELANERIKNANLQDSIDGLVVDMSLMESRISELSGESVQSDYGP